MTRAPSAAQRLGQERDGGDAVDVEVAEDGDSLVGGGGARRAARRRCRRREASKGSNTSWPSKKRCGLGRRRDAAAFEEALDERRVSGCRGGRRCAGCVAGASGVSGGRVESCTDDLFGMTGSSGSGTAYREDTRRGRYGKGRADGRSLQTAPHRASNGLGTYEARSPSALRGEGWASERERKRRLLLETGVGGGT